jgi:hypothetical protein
VTLEELDGTITEATVVRQQVWRREGRQFSSRVQTDLKYLIGPGEKFSWSMTPTVDTPSGRRQGKTVSVSSTLGRAAQSRANGGGDVVNMFNEGTLTNLFVYAAGGGFKREITFTRNPKSLNCSARESFARENGTGPIIVNSSIDDLPLSIISWKQVSSTCRVSKPNREPAKQ